MNVDKLMRGELNLDDSAKTIGPAKGKVLRVVLTEGAIRNGYINLGGDRSFFPPEFVANDQGESPKTFELVWPDGDNRTTKVLGKFGRIQARYNQRLSELQPGTVLLIQRDEQNPNRYLISIEPTQAFKADESENPKSMNATSKVNTLNQILFGPPGTGKTYHTVNEAIRILEPSLLETSNERAVLKAAFDRYVAAGQIVFTTFHQSFSYEDFVEGLRARSDNGSLEYLVEPGVFKQLCEQAKRGIISGEDPFDKALAVLQAKLEQTGAAIDMATSTGKHFGIDYEGGSTFRVYPESSQDLKVPYRANIEHIRNVYLTGNKSGIYNPSYVAGILSYLKQQCGLPTELPQQDTAERKRFVLIIDEINRGNISRIFGELITTIEASKRSGMPDALEVTLPYSKEFFGVPDNLFIIGTMNTADRSLAGLDIALRRRFTFKEMPPRPDLLDEIDIEDVNIGELLRTMNNRIEVLLDRDHCLGHAYFISLRDNPSLEELGRIFTMNILPLLQEYFFEDWERIAWVLNDQRKPNVQRFVQNTSDANLDNLSNLFGAEVAETLQDRRWHINEGAFSNIKSYRGIIGVGG